MNEQLESDLRASLRARAARVPDASIVRLSHVDYNPRTRRLRPPVAIGAIASTAGAAGALAAIFSLGAGASNAFAGWTPRPTPPAPGQLVAARASCEAARSPVAGLPLRLADTRGPFTFALYGDDRSTATCIKGPSFNAVEVGQSSSPVVVPAGKIVLSSSHSSERRGQAYSFAYGRAGAGVTGVTMVLADGTDVQATTKNGWFVAWWPGGHEPKSAEITTATGTTTQALDLPSLPPGSGTAGAGSGRSSFGVRSSSSGGDSGASRGSAASSFSVSP